MSNEHVAAMNELLLDAPAVRAACAELPGPRAMAYELTDGPDGQTVHWVMSFQDTVCFSLEPSPSADVTLSGDWSQMIRAARAGRDGGTVDPGLRLSGDAEALTEIGPAMELARSVATVPVDFPEI